MDAGEITIIHENGHAAIAIFLGHKVTRISTFASGSDAGECEWEWKNGKPVMADWRMILTGGFAGCMVAGIETDSETFWSKVNFSDDARLYRRLGGNETTFRSDLERAVNILRGGY